MNLPNKLTILRILLVPVFMIVMMVPFPMDPLLRNSIAAFIFIITSLTDMLDGKIARKRNLITTFGKFMDPLADKFMVFGALLSIIYVYRFTDMLPFIIIASALVFFRELAVTSIRLVVSGNEGIVVAASWLGKVKTVTQIVFICTILLEGVVFYPFSDCAFYSWNLLTYITMAAMVFMTLWSGYDYIKSYWKYVFTNK